MGDVIFTMGYELLKTFICLAKLENFTETAEQLHVVQFAVTGRIKHPLAA
jgi:LysR family transcriptional repressor of citA